MCRTVHAVINTVLCGIQMLVRVFMTVILMLENLIRMILQTFYNFISLILQIISLIPLCVVFLVTSKLKCFMCGGGGRPCSANRGGLCDYFMSVLAIIILFYILRAAGLLDVIFYKIGYVKSPPPFVPVPYTPTDNYTSTEYTDFTTTNYTESVSTTETTDNTTTNYTESVSTTKTTDKKPPDDDLLLFGWSNSSTTYPPIGRRRRQVQKFRWWPWVCTENPAEDAVFTNRNETKVLTTTTVVYYLT